MAALALLLAACSSTPRRGAPPAPSSIPSSAQLPEVPPSPDSVPDAVPRAEPRSPYGNPPFYDVFGKRYYVLSSGVGYVERGVASWYGPGFHKVRTSTGEPYDMYGMSAAHKTLPLPCYVLVTNLQNGRSVVVRVNDRGPFVGNRIIDLSYTAAAKLDMLRNGTAFVEVSSIDFPPPTTPSATRVANAAATGAATGAATPAATMAAVPATGAPSTFNSSSIGTPAAVPRAPTNATGTPAAAGTTLAPHASALTISSFSSTPAPTPTSAPTSTATSAPTSTATSASTSTPTSAPTSTPTSATTATAASASTPSSAIVAAPPRIIAPAPVTAPVVKTFFIQAGAFSDPNNAERLAAKLRGSGYGTVFVRDNELAGRRIYRVRIGPIASVEEFDRIVAGLAKDGIPDARIALD
jgi:rare lipoprotein A